MERKLKDDGSIDKYKARLLAKRFTLKEDINYFDTLVPTTRISSSRVLMAWAMIQHLFIHQMDARTTFLNGNIDEEIYYST